MNDKLPCCAKSGPYVMEMEPGTYYWCACGLSKNQPFCDGSHKGSEFSPEKVEITEKKKVGWCGCKQSKKGAICDGYHKNLPK
jgi:CDGSH iron-sulfur domain-containing protein 3